MARREVPRSQVREHKAMTATKKPQRKDIVDELQARGDALSLRAARYIRMKRTMLEGVQMAYRKLCARTLLEDRNG
jgi:hypothetical protein